MATTTKKDAAPKRGKRRGGPDGRGSGSWTAEFRGYFAESRSLALSVVLVSPLLLLYELALVYYPPAQPTGARSFVGDVMFAIFRSRALTALHVLAVAAFLVAAFVLLRRRTMRLNLVAPMVLESSGWAAVLVGIAVVIFRRLAHTRLEVGDAAPAAALKVIGSLGAGIYEELLFRLVLAGLLYFIGIKLFEGDKRRAGALAVVVSAAVFALCHTMAPPVYIHLLFYFTAAWCSGRCTCAAAWAWRSIRTQSMT